MPSPAARKDGDSWTEVPVHAPIDGLDQRVQPVEALLDAIEVGVLGRLAAILPDQDALRAAEEGVGLFLVDDGLDLLDEGDARGRLEGLAQLDRQFVDALVDEAAGVAAPLLFRLARMPELEVVHVPV